MHRPTTVLLAIATALPLVAAAPASPPAVTDPCGSGLAEVDADGIAVGPDGGGRPHLDICAVHLDEVGSALEVAVVVAGDTADRDPSDHWVVNFAIEGCGYAIHTFHNALTDTLSPPTTQLTRFCGEGGTVLLDSSELDGEVVRTRVDAADVEALGGTTPESWTASDVLGRTWVGASTRQGADAVHTWDTTAGSGSTVHADLP